MIVIKLNGPPEEMNLIGMALRNSQVATGRGALLIREGHEDDPVEGLIEKLLLGQSLSGVYIDADDPELNWKRDPMIILCGTAAQAYEDMEQRLPGIKRMVGDVYNVTIHRVGGTNPDEES